MEHARNRRRRVRRTKTVHLRRARNWFFDSIEAPDEDDNDIEVAVGGGSSEDL